MEAVMATTRGKSSMARDRSSRAAAEAALEFGRFRVLLRQRQLVADGVPIELGTRAFDLLLVLLEADGSLVTKDELLSRVWPGIVVAEENLKVQISLLRKAFGEDRDFIRTEFGRGYRFTAAVRSTVARGACQRPRPRGWRSSQRVVPQWLPWRPPHGWCVPKSLRQSLSSYPHWQTDQGTAGGSSGIEVLERKLSCLVPAECLEQ
jgi:DNA-binding winged helix-turn-helix (wHTH) protein